MILERTEHPDWLSNAYLVAEGESGNGVLIDGNGVAQPLLDRIERDRIVITDVLCTHSHQDHVDGIKELASRFGVPLRAHPLAAGSLGAEPMSDRQAIHSGYLEIRALETPGHCSDHLAFIVGEDDSSPRTCSSRAPWAAREAGASRSSGSRSWTG